eukprot:RCo034741
MYLWVFPSRDAAVGALSGASAGFVALLVAHPIETFKVRLQATPGPSVRSCRTLRAALGVYWRLLWVRPYSGIAIHLPQYAALNALRFAAFEAAKPWVGVIPNGPPPTTKQLFLSGAFAGVVVAATLHPLFMLKTMQQAQRSSILPTVRALWAQEGLRGFYRTFCLGFFRYSVALGVFFSAFPWLRARLTATPGSRTPNNPSSSPGAHRGDACGGSDWGAGVDRHLPRGCCAGEDVRGAHRGPGAHPGSGLRTDAVP